MSALTLMANEQQRLLQEVEHCRAHKLNRLMQLGDDTWLVAGRFDLFMQIKLPISNHQESMALRVISISDNDSRLLTVVSSGRPLQELLWSCAFYASGGELLPGCRRDDVIRLQRWPNFSRLPRTANSLRIAALLTSRSTSVVLASRILHIDESELYQFYSAAQSAGYCKAVNRAEPVEIPAENTSPRLAIVRKLLNQLGFRPAALSV